jgi:hypothetical protein
MKDLFIDNNIAKNFSYPVDTEYKKLISWLMKNDKSQPNQNAYLVLSKKIINEYNRSSAQSYSNTCMPVIVDKLIKEGRKNFIKNDQIKNFRRKYFTKRITNKLKSNQIDWDHIPTVLLSDRKYALSLDDNFINDLRNFPGFTVQVEKRPEDLPYI